MSSITYKTYDELLEGIKAYLEENSSTLTDWNVGSVLRSICEPNADMGRILMLCIQNVALQRFITHATLQRLDSHGADHSQTRKSGTYATSTSCVFTISPQANVFTIPLGTVINTKEPTPRYYVTTEEGTIDAGDATVTLPIRAEEIGTGHNCPAHYISGVQNLSGIVEIDNTTACTGGTDGEDDNSFRERLLLYLSSGLARATRGALEYGALSVDGVVSAKIRSNLRDHWETYSCVADELEYTGVWSSNTGAYYYGLRKTGSGTISLSAIMRSCIIYLWATPSGGSCTLYIDGVPQVVDLYSADDTLVKIEHEFDTEGWHTVLFDTGENDGTLEKIDAKANYNGTNFIYIDDGTGEPSWEIVRDVYAEMENWVSTGEQFFVKRTEIKTVDITITLTVAERSNRDAISTLVEGAVTDYVDALSMGAILDESQLKAIVIGTSDNIKTAKTNITTVEPEAHEVIRVGSVSVLYG
jgi:uncharacterized phage protein gp47/JayE